ncbi:hypothetical protein BGZ58_006270, partial [Dissophora ornata]
MLQTPGIDLGAEPTADESAACLSPTLPIISRSLQSSRVTESNSSSSTDTIRQHLKIPSQETPVPQHNLGDVNRNGDSVLLDNPKAMKRYLKAANKGHANSQYNLGVMFSNGKGVPQDYTKAME